MVPVAVSGVEALQIGTVDGCGLLVTLVVIVFDPGLLTELVRADSGAWLANKCMLDSSWSVSEADLLAFSLLEDLVFIPGALCEQLASLEDILGLTLLLRD